MPGSLFHRILIAPLPYMPKPLVWRFSRRYIAGVDLDSAYKTVNEMNALGCTATIDVLGEDSTNRQQVETARDLYFEALDGIAERSLDCYASIKLSEMGLRFDQDLCYEVMGSLVARAAEHGNFVRIDMEDSSVTTVTLDIYRRLRRKYDNIGTVIQSCLRRTEQDVSDLLAEGPTNLRLCKGIYIEPEEIAYTDADDIRQSFCNLLEQLFAGGATRVGIATHDPLLVKFAEELISKNNIGKERYEFQMLLGVAENMRASLVSKGHPLRVYVPFGQRWFAYSMRRLRENPGIAMHIIRNLFTRN